MESHRVLGSNIHTNSERASRFCNTWKRHMIKHQRTTYDPLNWNLFLSSAHTSPSDEDRASARKCQNVMKGKKEKCTCDPSKIIKQNNQTFCICSCEKKCERNPESMYFSLEYFNRKTVQSNDKSKNGHSKSRRTVMRQYCERILFDKYQNEYRWKCIINHNEKAALQNKDDEFECRCEAYFTDEELVTL